MAKEKTEFVCSECGYKTGKWLGKCPSCNNWNTLVEEVIQTASTSLLAKKSKSMPAKIYTFKDIPTTSEKRVKTGISEFDRVIGGGVVKGSVVLSGGEPGIGKSTLFLQIAKSLCLVGKVLYVSGEESPAQIKMRATRLGIEEEIYIMAETEVGSIIAGIEELKPQFVIVDSVQTIYDADLSSAPASVSQVRGCAALLTNTAKRMGIATFIIGHVTKEGAIAGPRVLEHIVDTVLYFEGEKTSNLRILRAVKNRFGSTDEIGVFEMRDIGMSEVLNPTMLPTGEHLEKLNGISIYPAIQGTRPMLLEIQALCSHTQLAIPRRMASGIDVNRLYMLCAVLEKKIGLKLYNQDIFINVAGGIKIKEQAADLPLAVSIVSSLRNLAYKANVAYVGEIGLSGEIRHVSGLNRRINECEKMGFTKVFVPKQSIEGGAKPKIEVVGVSTLLDVLTKI